MPFAFPSESVFAFAGIPRSAVLFISPSDFIFGSRRLEWEADPANASPQCTYCCARDLVEAGKVRPVIDRCYQLSEVPDAIRHLETEHASGKLVVTIRR